jgi:hypothetical protein
MRADVRQPRPQQSARRCALERRHLPALERRRPHPRQHRDGHGEDGVVLDGNSDLNRVIGNDVHGHATDLRNDGESNCFTDNGYDTSSGDVSEPC